MARLVEPEEMAPDSARPRRAIWAILQLGAAAAFTPARVWANNLAETQSASGLILWTALMWALGVGIWACWIWLGGKSRSVTIAVFWLLLALGSVGSLFHDEGIRIALVLAGVVLVVAIAYRLADTRAFQTVTTWAVFYVLLLPIGMAVMGWTSTSAPEVTAAPPIATGQFTSHPDVVVLVSDAHGAFEVLDDLYGFDVDRTTAELEASGLTLIPGMKANYSLTYLSLPAFFDMNYPVGADEIVTDGDLRPLLQAVGGQNRMTEAFRSEGYQFVMVEAGWSGSHCTSAVDVCFSSPWPDDAASFAIERSAFNVAKGILKGSHTAGTLSTLDWLDQELPGYLSNDRPDLIFAHLLTPHPPLWLGPDCVYRWRPEHGGLTVGIPNLDAARLEMRMDAYLDQVTCAQSAIRGVADLIDENAIFLAFGDHGPDSQAQLFKVPPDWSQSDIEERMRVFFAWKGAECDFHEVSSLVNVGRRLLTCLTGTAVEEIPDLHFIATGPSGPAGESMPMREVDVSS